MILPCDEHPFNIPLGFLFDRQLSAAQKLICAQVHANEMEVGYSAFTNSYFAALTSLSKEAAASNIKSLIDSYVLEQAPGDDHRRRLRVNDTHYRPKTGWWEFHHEKFYQHDMETQERFYFVRNRHRH